MNDVFLTVHGGLGDHIVCNAIYRNCADRFSFVEIPVKKHNVPSVRFMLRDRENFSIIPVRDDAEMLALSTAMWRKNNVLRLGMFGKNFDEKHWSESMYAQADIPFEKRWTDWKVERDLSREFKVLPVPYAFVHDDERFHIDRALIPKDLWLTGPFKERTANIFDYTRLIEEAQEIHVIDSCFAILADSLPSLKAKRKVVHLYSRPNALPPTYSPGWEILK